MDLIKLQNINVSYDKKTNILENLNLNINFYILYICTKSEVLIKTSLFIG